MANLNFTQKQLIEEVFGMGGGYFLDFSNREFNEFMKDVVDYSVYDKYPGLSKAKIFRAFCQDNEERFVGKAIILAINYMKEKGLDKGDIKVDKLYEFGKELLGKQFTKRKVNENKASTRITPKSFSIDYDQIATRLMDVEKESTQQRKGYAFERFIFWMFEIFDLDPKAPYKTETDQIDGSFKLGDSTVLIETKYHQSIIDKTDLVLFQDKLKHKSIHTRGLFISYSEVSNNAISYFSNQSPRITIMYASEIFQLCRYHANLVKILKMKFRHLDETGCIWCPVDFSSI